MNENGQRLLELCSYLCSYLAVYHKIIFPDQASAQSVMQKPPVQTLAYVRPDTHKTQQPEVCPPQPQLPMCRLRHGPLIGVWKDQTSAKETPSFQTRGETPHRCQHNNTQRKCAALYGHLRGNPTSTAAPLTRLHCRHGNT